MKRPVLSAAVFFGLALSASAGLTAGAELLGEWRVADGSATIAIKKCGPAYCGYVASTVGPADKDYKNPNPSLRNRSTLGIQILFDLRSAGDNVWTGLTYNAQDGQTYNAKLSMNGSAAMNIQGCVPNGGLCGSETWARVK